MESGNSQWHGDSVGSKQEAWGSVLRICEVTDGEGCGVSDGEP